MAGRAGRQKGWEGMGYVTDLWEMGRAPYRNGLYRADDSVRAIEVDGPDLSVFRLGPLEDFDLPGVKERRETTTLMFNPGCCLELPGRSGFVCGGEGSLGADGFFARLAADRSLVWVASMENANPFERVEIEGWTARFFNNLGNSVVVDFRDPAFDVR
ncbi:hypothetical protein [Streptomyces sp. NPDC060184]|uniref:hypothetical protein n=1 Tax=Streptomyces sp. NPDC060184 TaxID=3347064 RepID=UPI00365FBA9E